MEGNQEGTRLSSLITRHKVFAAFGAAVVLASGIMARAAAQPYGFGEIRLGSSYGELARQLDFRDINTAITNQRASKAARADLGRRGFGCTQGDKLHADIICVSHDERVGGEPTREVRLQFFDGILQRFSITAEIAKRNAILAALRAEHGAPQETETRMGADGAFPSERWRNADSSIRAYSGRDLVYVAFELAGYGDAQARRQRESAVPPR